MTTAIEFFGKLGYNVEHTGGGCEALVRWLNDDAYIMITAWDDPSIPEGPWDRIAVGLYVRDDNDEFHAEFFDDTSIGFGSAAILASGAALSYTYDTLH